MIAHERLIIGFDIWSDLLPSIGLEDKLNLRILWPRAVGFSYGNWDRKDSNEYKKMLSFPVDNSRGILPPTPSSVINLR